MKIRLLTLLASTLVALGSLNAQSVAVSPAAVAPVVVPVATVEREEATGTITDVTAGRSLVLHTGTDGGEPVVFRFAPEVTYVDDDGKVIEAAGLRKNLRVRLSYVKSGVDNIIDKVTILE